MDKVVYIASPLSGDVEQNLDFARQACRYAISQGVVPFAPHLLYTQMLDDNSPQERQAGIEMGCRMLERCDELWLCGERISPGMAAERNWRKAWASLFTVSAARKSSLCTFPLRRGWG